VENAEEAEDVVPNYDSLSHTSAYYEKVNEPNPAYQQYRKQSESISINMMNPKYSEQTVENALYSGVAALLPDEDVPSTTISFMPGSETKLYKDETDDALYSTADDALYSSVDKDAKPVTSNNTDMKIPAATVPEGADKEPPIYAVPIKKSSRVKNPENDMAENPTGQWVSPEVDTATTAQQQDSADMSIFVSKSQTKLDSETPNTSPTNDTDNVFDDMINPLNRELSPRRYGQLENRGSIVSTTSEDRDLLNPEVKLHDHPKKSHPKPNIMSSMVSAAKAKLTPSPKVKRVHEAKSTMPDKSKQPSDLASSKLSSCAATDQQQQSQVKYFSQPQQTRTKPPIGTKSKFDTSLIQASPKLKPSNSHLSAMATNQQGSGRISPNVRLHPNTSSKSQGNPLQPLKDRSSPRTPRKGTSVDSALQNIQVIPVNQTIPQQGKSQAQPHPTSQHQASPLQQLRAKSSPRVKPRGSPGSQNKQVAPANQVTQQRKPDTQLRPTDAPVPHQANPLQQLRGKSSPRVKPREIPAFQKALAPNRVVAQQQAHSYRSSIATETPSLPESLGVNKPVEKQRPKSAVTVGETVTKTADITTNIGTTISFKEKRKQEAQDFDDTFKDFEDFLATI